MNNDELLQRQAALITTIADQGGRLQVVIGDGRAEEASTALKNILEAVDELRAGVRPQPYYPAMGEEVWVRGRVVEVNDTATSFKVQFSENAAYDYHWINPGQNEVKPL